MCAFTSESRRGSKWRSGSGWGAVDGGLVAHLAGGSTHLLELLLDLLAFLLTLVRANLAHVVLYRAPADATWSVRIVTAARLVAGKLQPAPVRTTAVTVAAKARLSLCVMPPFFSGGQPPLSGPRQGWDVLDHIAQSALFRTPTRLGCEPGKGGLPTHARTGQAFPRPVSHTVFRRGPS
jgi:hypothetical protein